MAFLFTDRLAVRHDLTPRDGDGHPRCAHPGLIAWPRADAPPRC